MRNILLALPETQILFEGLNYIEYIVLKNILSKKKNRRVPYQSIKAAELYSSLIYDEPSSIPLDFK